MALNLIMQAISTSLLLYLAIGGPGARSQQSSCPDGGFITSCVYPGYNFTGSNLGMYCMNDQVEIFAYNWTWLDLNLCVANNAGRLIAWDTGDYSNSCTNCEVNKNETLSLACDCADMDGSRISSTLDLDTVIYNVDGAMGCCGNLGAKSWARPSADDQGLRGILNLP